MTNAIPVQQLRDALSDVLNRTAFGHERIVVERRGRAVAALVPLADLEQLEAVEPAGETRPTRKR